MRKLIVLINGVLVLGVSLVILEGEKVEADSAEARSKVSASFTFSDTIGDIKPVDPINPDPSVPGNPGGPSNPDLPEEEIPVGPGTGSNGDGLLKIDYVSNFYFGKMEYHPLEGADSYAYPETWVTEDGEKTTVPNYVQVSDLRANNKGWNLTVTQESPFKSGDSELQGAQMSLANITSQNISGSQNPEVSSGEQVLKIGESIKIASAKATTPSNIGESIGVGTNIIRFGDTQTMKESVKLHVPSGVSVIKDVAYSTSLLWTLNDTPL
ncbi:WxL domain-containing protein [Vagococcus xieshaowenii]|uniref:WxL domain-containing protein n=1 Tax=Vagococcus xieshaowenii TaxID=2562451 RepID=A0AAJ5JLK1_9ENTE|nr:WxL domain-containing protein [Vagococcus xieshaowenii]QCA29697.1 WxL domain-containing protein [Vagococcus xieshaowenii]TFZ42912.1 WxL domain-containing protein [Vagococcus xieshaowenii]